MEIYLQLNNNDLLIHEGTRGRLLIQNSGTNAIEIPNPDVHDEWPTFRVVGPISTKVSEYKPAQMWKKKDFIPIPDDPTIGTILKLAGGSSVTFEFDLLDRLELPVVGEYEITAIIQGQNKLFTSPPIKVVVREINPTFSDYVYSYSGISPLLYSAWTHKGQKTGLVLFRGLDLLTHFKQTLSFRVAEVIADVQPTASVSPNGLPWPDHWVGWLTGKQLSVALVSQRSVIPPMRQAPVDFPSPQLLRPLLMDPATRTGYALLWSNSADGAIMQPVLIDNNIVLEPKIPIEIPSLQWSQLFYYSNGLRRLLLLSEKESKTVLYKVDWPKEALLQKPIELLCWPEKMLVAGAVMDEEDNIYGAVITWPLTEGVMSATLQMNRWRISTDGASKTSSKEIIDWPFKKSILNAVVRINAVGKPYSLLQREDGIWMYIPPGGDQPQLLPDEANEHVGPIDIIFVNDVHPLLLYYNGKTGLKYKPIT